MNKFFTIEVYNRRKWSDRYSCQYSTLEEAAERARELFKDYELNDFTIMKSILISPTIIALKKPFSKKLSTSYSENLPHEAMGIHSIGIN